jgi:hypothetical protein
MNLCFYFYCAVSLRISICDLYVQQILKSNELSKFAKNTPGNWNAPLESCISFLLRKRRDVNIFCVSLFTEISSYTWKSRTVGKNVSRAKLKLTEQDVWHQQESNVHLSQALTLKMALSKSILCVCVCVCVCVFLPQLYNYCTACRLSEESFSHCYCRKWSECRKLFTQLL